MIGNNFKTKSAFTLIEVLVAVSVFVVIVLTSARIFQSVLDSQRNNSVDQDVQENVKYFLEVFSREVRGAQRNISGVAQCGVDDTHILATNVDNDELYFRNSAGQCVAYYLESDNGLGRIKIERNGYSDFLTSSRVDVSGLKFVIDDTSTSTQPVATVNVQIRSENNPSLPAYNIQTTISPRALN